MVKTQKPVGIVDGKFYPCPNTPNCVSTQATDAKHKISPISYSGTMSEAKEKIIKIVNSLKRTKIITNTENYIHAEVRTATFKFVDDVEFLFDDSEKIIQFHSRARSGHSDMGVNRKRKEKIREMLINK